VPRVFENIEGGKKMSYDLTTEHYIEFDEMIEFIKQSREKAYRAINYELITLYWEIGKFVSLKAMDNSWGKSIVKGFSLYIQKEFVGIKGFSPQNIWRMKQFYETYHKNEKLSALLREISWTNNTLIFSNAKNDEEREFYLNLAIENNYSSRELERQIDSGLYERTMISNVKNQLQINKNTGLSALRDSYVLEFMNLPEQYEEKELRKGIVANLRDFILEFGKDFTLVGEEYRVQVGNMDFNIDLLFFNRELSCLVAIELKIGRFKPADLGQLEFYLEALDRDVKKKNENPSVGLILCTKKDDDVVEYALSRSMSPTLIAEYQTHLPKKELLTEKLRELRETIGIDFEDKE